ncbi:hypothetical protein [Plantactinospora sp. GCM10030261]|uniref:hypothetical protein n=1 Tax=Plantactinospora sp. GCM10030261 TaxID=3273420 RepID=UPI0036100363
MAEIGSEHDRGAIFADARGEDRGMRITHHPELGIVVVSLWLGPLCRGSFRLPADDVDRLVAALTAGREVTVRSGVTQSVDVGPEPAQEPTPEQPAGPAKPKPPGTGTVDPTAITAAVQAVPA